MPHPGGHRPHLPTRPPGPDAANPPHPPTHPTHAAIPADYSPFFTRFFGWWAREKVIAPRFFAVRLALGSRAHFQAIADHPGPVLALTNHVSWWDPLVMLTLHRLFFPRRTLRAPMDAAQLNRFRFFTKLGTFGIDPDDPASLDLMAADMRTYFAHDPGPTLWINPQGRFADVREPVEPRPGAARLAAQADNPRLLAVAIEYAFWLDQRPELLLRAQPVHSDRTNTAGWHRAIRDAMRINAAALADMAIARDPAAFEALIGGGAPKINPVYDLWLHLRGRRGAIDDRSDRTGRTDRTGRIADHKAAEPNEPQPSQNPRRADSVPSP